MVRTQQENLLKGRIYPYELIFFKSSMAPDELISPIS